MKKTIAKKLGLNRNLNEYEQAYIEKWILEFNYGIDIIEIALKNGSTLVVDEFDASIHPMVLMNIIKIFHNDEINTKGAQLIFNTHNPIFLNSSLFRRDEIKFVERNEETNCSEVYSLSDFRTSGKYGVRKTDDYMKNYFVNRYGAIKDVDLSDHFLNIIEHDQEEVQ